MLIILILISGCSTNETAEDKFIAVNHVGYRPEFRKIVFTNLDCDEFGVIDAKTGTNVFTGKLILHQSFDPETGEKIFTGDFSDFGDSGTFIIRIGSLSSVEFEITEKPYEHAYANALKSFYFQRCGVELDSVYAGEFVHKTCHVNDAVYHSTTQMNGRKDMTGGWHDAGDYGKYVVNAGITVGTMLMAYEHHPYFFNSDSIGIPESHNSIPDLLDECRFELEWLLKMQHNDGGVHHKVTREKFAPFIMPEEDTETRFIFEISSTATADFCAVMALASRIFAVYDDQFATICERAALKSWQFLEKFPQMIPDKGFRNPEGVNTGGYGDFSDQDERLWAAMELYLTTKDVKYKNYYNTNYHESKLIETHMSWPFVDNLAHLSYLKADLKMTDEAIRSEIVRSLVSYSDTLVAMHEQSGFHVLLRSGEYEWGCNSTIMNRAILLISAYKETGDEKYLHVAFDQLHFLMGTNVQRMTFITGIGDTYPMNIHLRQAAADMIAEPIPGFLVGGANQKLQDAVLRKAYNKTTPPAKCYLDVLESYASNEVAINWNAPLLYVMGYLNSVQLQN